MTLLLAFTFTVGDIFCVYIAPRLKLLLCFCAIHSLRVYVAFGGRVFGRNSLGSCIGWLRGSGVGGKLNTKARSSFFLLWLPVEAPNRDTGNEFATPSFLVYHKY